MREVGPPVTDRPAVKRRVPLPRSTKPIARSAIKSRTKRPKARNTRRHASEWARAYGSKKRVAFVKSLPCCVAGCRAAWMCEPSENAHTVNGGMGRKADANTIAPLCHGHHRFLHHHGPQTFAASFPLRHGWTLVDWARETERLWGAFE